jgi:hypothetical protein
MEAPRSTLPDYLERVSRWLTLFAAAAAAVACVAAPLLAISWSHQAFPGFVVEPTLVVNNTRGTGWGGSLTGLHPPQRVTRVGGQAVATAAEYAAALSRLSPGQYASFFVTLPDGSARLYPSIPLTRFPQGDLLRLFWLPYLAGLAYLGIGIWIYVAKGSTRPGRALAFFCYATAVASALSFDLATTHAMTDLWSVAIAMMGGALISLAMRFPQEWRPVGRRAWLLSLPYLLSIALAAGTVIALHDAANPWRYSSAWNRSYIYAVVGVAVFLGITLYRSVRGRSSMVRRQARIVLLGSALAFVPVAGWFAATAFGLPFPVDAPLLLTSLVLFPLSVAIAIFRYRLLEIDHVVNRAILYGMLMALLAGLYSIAIMISQRVFVVVTGEKSDAAIVITTLIVASAFTPIKDLLGKLINKWLKEPTDNTRALVAFRGEVTAHLQMSDGLLLARRFLDEAARALRAESGAVSLVIDGRLRTAGTSGRWRGEAAIAVPLQHDGQRYGLLWLGPRLDGQPYSQAEFETLQQTALPVAQALHLDMHVHSGIECVAPGSPIAAGGHIPFADVAPDARPSSPTQAVSAPQ